MKIQAIDALLILCPNAEFVLTDGKIVEWHSPEIPQPTEEEINTKLTELEAAEPFRLLREERNRRLTACDWVVTKNAEYGQNISKEWRAYRQALRDLPSITYTPEIDEYGYLKMDSVAWPTPPE